MDSTTIIDEANTKISFYDENIGGLQMNNNKNISYLPIDVAERFPNLQGYQAGFCGIKELTRRNFKGLSKLRGLWLSYNQIERFLSETFVDLIGLEYLYLGDNEFKFKFFLFLISWHFRWQQNPVYEPKTLQTANQTVDC